jgi:hypothetical protein
LALGRIWRIRSRRFLATSTSGKEVPVTLPPGRALAPLIRIQQCGGGAGFS